VDSACGRRVPGVAPMVGSVGLHCVAFAAPFTPAVEVGWRLARDRWGHGYATEAARAAVQVGYQDAELEGVVSFTTPGNVRSWKAWNGSGWCVIEHRTSSTRTCPRDIPCGTTSSTASRAWLERRRSAKSGRARGGAAAVADVVELDPLLEDLEVAGCGDVRIPRRVVRRRRRGRIGLVPRVAGDAMNDAATGEGAPSSG